MMKRGSESQTLLAANGNRLTLALHFMARLHEMINLKPAYQLGRIYKAGGVKEWLPISNLVARTMKIACNFVSLSLL